jgi:hypothetical protein
MDKELEKLMKKLVSTQKSGNEVNINNTVNELKTYLNPIQKRLFSQPLPEDNENLMDDEVDIETIASNYYEVIKFVLKRMKVKKFDEIRFSLKNNYLLVSIVKKGKEFYLDFNAYVHHNDEQETEYLMEIEALYASSSALDWNSVIDLIKKKDWSKYCSEELVK